MNPGPVSGSHTPQVRPPGASNSNYGSQYGSGQQYTGAVDPTQLAVLQPPRPAETAPGSGGSGPVQAQRRERVRPVPTLPDHMRGTPEYRRAFAERQRAIEDNLAMGFTLEDMGLQNSNTGAGHAYSIWGKDGSASREGDVAEWAAANPEFVKAYGGNAYAAYARNAEIFARKKEGDWVKTDFGWQDTDAQGNHYNYDHYGRPIGPGGKLIDYHTNQDYGKRSVTVHPDPPQDPDDNSAGTNPPNAPVEYQPGTPPSGDTRTMPPIPGPNGVPRPSSSSAPQTPQQTQVSAAYSGQTIPQQPQGPTIQGSVSASAPVPQGPEAPPQPSGSKKKDPPPFDPNKTPKPNYEAPTPPVDRNQNQGYNYGANYNSQAQGYNQSLIYQPTGPSENENQLLGLITQLAQLLQGQGEGLFNIGLPAYAQAVEYYQKLLGGDRATMQGAVAPSAEMIRDSYQGLTKGVLSGTVRGGGRDQALGEIQRQQGADIAHLISGVQPAAANALMSGGLAGAQTAMQGEAAGGQFYVSALNNLTQGRLTEAGLAQGSKEFAAGLELQERLGLIDASQRAAALALQERMFNAEMEFQRMVFDRESIFSKLGIGNQTKLANQQDKRAGRQADADKGSMIAQLLVGSGTQIARAHAGG